MTHPKPPCAGYLAGVGQCPWLATEHAPLIGVTMSVVGADGVPARFEVDPWAAKQALDQLTGHPDITLILAVPYDRSST